MGAREEEEEKEEEKEEEEEFIWSVQARPEGQARSTSFLF